MSGTIPGVNGTPGHPASGGEGTSQDPVLAWSCNYEVSSLSWAPQSILTSTGDDWLGISGGRGVWGVCLS